MTFLGRANQRRKWHQEDIDALRAMDRQPSDALRYCSKQTAVLVLKCLRTTETFDGASAHQSVEFVHSSLLIPRLPASCVAFQRDQPAWRSKRSQTTPV